MLHTVIPAQQLPIVENALQETFNTTSVTNIAPLSGGLSTSSVYKITINDRSYVLKLDSPLSECMEIASNAGVAPSIIYQNKEHALSITSYIDQSPLRSAFTSPDLLVTELAKTLRSIHAMPAFSKQSSLFETVESLINETKTSPLYTPTVFGNFFDLYAPIQQHYPWHDTDKVPSHNDLNPGNFVYDGKKIWVIDWDAAFQNDRYVDLAATANFFIHTDANEQLFLETYFGTPPTPYQTARFFIMRQISRLIYSMLMFKLARTANSTNPDNRNNLTNPTNPDNRNNPHNRTNPDNRNNPTNPTNPAHAANPNPACLAETANPAYLTETNAPEFQTATLKTVGPQLSSGQLSLATWKGQLYFGKALLNEAQQNIRSPRFAASIMALY